jgi:hypothetical protein
MGFVSLRSNFAKLCNGKNVNVILPFKTNENLLMDLVNELYLLHYHLPPMEHPQWDPS